MRRLRAIMLPLLCFSAASGWRGHAPLTVRGSRARAAVRAAAWERRPRPSPWRSPINVEAPGINGGDPWAGARGTDEDVKLVVDEAMSQTVVAPIMQQFYPQRDWLWSRWTGTIVARVLTREVLWTSLFAALFIVAFGRISAAATSSRRRSARRRSGRLWTVALGKTSASSRRSRSSCTARRGSRGSSSCSGSTAGNVLIVGRHQLNRFNERVQVLWSLMFRLFVGP